MELFRYVLICLREENERSAVALDCDRKCHVNGQQLDNFPQHPHVNAGLGKQQGNCAYARYLLGVGECHLHSINQHCKLKLQTNSIQVKVQKDPLGNDSWGLSLAEQRKTDSISCIFARSDWLNHLSNSPIAESSA